MEPDKSNSYHPMIGLPPFTAETFAVFATYDLDPESIEQFLCLAKAHAKHTMSVCRGCLRYDVVWISKTQVVFYELYDSLDSFEEHTSSQYLAEFRIRRAEMVRHHLTQIGRLITNDNIKVT